MAISAADRFWSYVLVDVVSGCWLWTGASQGGYGRFRSGDGGAQAHRYSYESLVGPIPKGMHLDHLCRNPPCVNPAHLEPVTPEENSRRANRSGGRRPKARWRTVNPPTGGLPPTKCPRGHEYNPANTLTYMRPNGVAMRWCRLCPSPPKRQFAKPPAPRHKLRGTWNQTEVARQLGVSRQRVGQLAKAGWLPLDGEGKVDDVSLDALVTRRNERAFGRTGLP
jgi:hypothetical protein